MKRLFLFAAVFSVLTGYGAGYIRVELDGKKNQVDFRSVAVSGKLKTTEAVWVDKALRSSHLLIESKVPLSDRWQLFEFSFTPAGSGEVRLWLRGNWTKKTHLQWVEYDHLDVSGANLFNPSFESLSRGAFTAWRLRKANMAEGDAAVGKRFVRCAHDFSVSQDIFVTAGKRVTVKFFARSGRIEQPRPPVTPLIWEQVTAQNRFATNFPKEYYRYYDSRVKLLPLKNKGIRPEALVFEKDTVNTPLPEAEFKIPAISKEIPEIQRDVKVELLEESGVARTAQVRFGFPIPKGVLRDLTRIEVLSPGGKRVPAQFSALGFWQDKSVKWVLVQFKVPLKAREKLFYTLRFGRDTVPETAASPLKFRETPSEIRVDTGRMSAVIDKRRFAFLRDVTTDGRVVGSFSPLTVCGEKGEILSSAAMRPEKITVLENGSEYLSFKITGKYGRSAANSPGTYSVIIGFAANSSVADIAVTHINTNLNTEFTDISSLAMAFKPATAADSLQMDEFKVGRNRRIFQLDDMTLDAAGRRSGEKLSGSGTVQTGAEQITFVLRDAAMRWPKAFNTAGGKIIFELLPPLPDKKFAAHLPHYLQFPFCEGKYRLKWGMSFTERMKIDFSGKASAAELGALEIVPVIDRDYLAECGAVTGVPAASVTAFDLWNRELIAGFYAHMVMKAKQREYGFLNYGDWFGERSRNWTNNEYDPAHGLFMLFCRTGNRDVFRWAQTAARHQADVDIIHAYPDPFYVGVNAQHGVGHTGVSHQNFINPATWSYPVDVTFSGINGHTWSDGMLDAWCFTGDVQVMDAALKLGEHMSRYIAPRFTKLGTHERSAGWSIRSLLACYRVTGEERYLAGARRIAGIAMSEQKFDKGGAWPHKLPGDHSGGYKDAFGNACFLIGILTNALRDYHLLTGDPAAAKSLAAAAQWQKKNFDRRSFGFPYTASWDNVPYYASGFGSNCLIIPGMLYGGCLAKDREIYDIAALAAAVESVRGVSPVGKDLAMSLSLAAEFIDGLLRFQKENPEVKPFAVDPDAVVGSFNKNSFNLRGPDRKELRITLRSPAAQLKISRTRTGARPHVMDKWQMVITSPDGKVAAERSGSVKAALYNEKIALSGKAGDKFSIVINDDMGGYWNVEPCKDHFTEIKAVPDTSFSVASPAVFNFEVPAGTEQFTFRVTGAHPGIFRAWAIAPDGRIAAMVSGVNDTGPRFPWLKVSGDLSKKLTVKFSKPAEKSSRWKLLVITGGDVNLDMSGIPPWLSIVENQ